MKDGKENIPCYVGLAPCGCMVSAIVDDPELRERMKSDIKKFLSDCIRDGLTIDRTTVGDIRKNFGHTCGLKPENPTMARQK